MTAYARFGFALKELLVVLAVMLLLVIILFPVMPHHPEPDHNSCLNNQRQLSIALMMYANDHEETLPLPSDWVSATQLTPDPKVFNCYKSKHEGNPSAPDYGMNAFLYEIDPETGKKVPLAVGLLPDPTAIELTADINGPTGKNTGDAFKDAFTNPFPETYTANGYYGKGTTVDLRHEEKTGVSFLDGHVSLEPNDIDADDGATEYNIPYGPGRCYIDFTEPGLTAAEVTRRLKTVFALSPGGWPGSVGYAFDAKKKCLTLSGQLATEGKGKSDDPAYDTFIPGTGNARLTIEFRCTEGTKLAFCSPLEYAGKFPAADPKGEAEHLGSAFVIDTEHDYIQTGMLQCFSDQRYRGYKPLTWIDLPPELKGHRSAIDPGARHFVVEAMIQVDKDKTVPFPTQRRRPWQLTADREKGKMAAAAVRLKVSMPGKTPESTKPEDLWFANAYSLEEYGRAIRVTDGTAEITRLVYSASP